MIRRSVHTSGRVAGLAVGLLAVALLSSCSSPSSPGSDVVASANGVELTSAKLAQLMGTPAPPNGPDSPDTTSITPTTAGPAPTADDTRQVMSEWMRVAVIGGDMSTITSRKELKKVAEAASAELAQPFLGPVADEYAKGFGGSPKVCLGAIPLAAATDPDEVIAAMNGGMSLAEAAVKYSADPAFVATKGVATLQSGSTCGDPASLNPDFTKQMEGTKPGEPVLVSLGSGQAIVIVRPFDTLAPAEQVGLDAGVQTQVAKEFAKQLQGADMFVDKRYGRWDPDTGSVVPLVVG